MTTKFLPRQRTSCQRSSRMPENSQPNFAGIEVALKTLRGVVLSAAGQTLGRAESNYEPEDLINAVTELTRELQRSGDIKSVGLAIPGLVNRETDRVLVSTNLPF